MPHDWWLRKLRKERLLELAQEREEWERENEMRYSCRLCGELLDDALPHKIAYCQRCRKRL